MPNNYLEKLFSLKEKTALIIGGTGELCGTIAEGLAKAGADIVLVGRSREKADSRLKILKNIGVKSTFVLTDVSNKNALENILEEGLKLTGKVDILINGAGVNSATPFFDISDDEMQNILDVNYKSVVWACQIFGRYFMDNKINGSIINIGSVSGLTPLSKVFTYSASKGALHNLTKNLAREWATHNIRLNTIIPGFFPAEQNKKILKPERVDRIMQHTPMNRFGESRELIGAALLLASSNAGSFITGTEMIVDGGFSSMTI